jgi:hypothetical protein
LRSIERRWNNESSTNEQTFPVAIPLFTNVLDVSHSRCEWESIPSFYSHTPDGRTDAFLTVHHYGTTSQNFQFLDIQQAILMLCYLNYRRSLLQNLILGSNQQLGVRWKRCMDDFI